MPSVYCHVRSWDSYDMSGDTSHSCPTSGTMLDPGQANICVDYINNTGSAASVHLDVNPNPNGGDPAAKPVAAHSSGTVFFTIEWTDDTTGVELTASLRDGAGMSLYTETTQEGIDFWGLGMMFGPRGRDFKLAKADGLPFTVHERRFPRRFDERFIPQITVVIHEVQIGHTPRPRLIVPGFPAGWVQAGEKWVLDFTFAVPNPLGFGGAKDTRVEALAILTNTKLVPPHGEWKDQTRFRIG